MFYPTDINFSKLSELVEHMQGEMATFQNDANSQLEHLETDINNVRTLADTASKDSTDSGKIFSTLNIVKTINIKNVVQNLPPLHLASLSWLRTSRPLSAPSSPTVS